MHGFGKQSENAKQVGPELSMEEIRRIQLDMLDALDVFCTENGLRYYLSGGSLLGAIRHQGFIPWDDDIDINIPRPDFEKLLQLTEGKLSEHLLLVTPQNNSHHLAFSRLYDTRTVLYSSSPLDKDYGYHIHVFIDIFPIEGLPESNFKLKCLYQKTFFLMTMANIAYFTKNSAKTKSKALIKLLVTPLAKAIPYQKWNHWANCAAQQYDYEDCDYIGVVSTRAAHRMRERIAKQHYEPIIRIPFEDREYNAPKNYDTYLRNLYGDYMIMPPEEKRHSGHSFKVWWKEGVQG